MKKNIVYVLLCEVRLKKDNYGCFNKIACDSLEKARAKLNEIFDEEIKFKVDEGKVCSCVCENKENSDVIYEKRDNYFKITDLKTKREQIVLIDYVELV